MIVVADTSPLNYLIQIQCDHILMLLYGRVIVPVGVLDELRSPKAPRIVSTWSTDPPVWISVQRLSSPLNPDLNYLDRGEREAIQLAEEHIGSLLLIDERKGRSEAVRRGLYTTGTLGVLLAAEEAGLVDAREAYRRLIEQTTFRTSAALEAEFLKRF